MLGNHGRQWRFVENCGGGGNGNRNTSSSCYRYQWQDSTSCQLQGNKVDKQIQSPKTACQEVLIAYIRLISPSTSMGRNEASVKDCNFPHTTYALHIMPSRLSQPSRSRAQNPSRLQAHFRLSAAVQYRYLPSIHSLYLWMQAVGVASGQSFTAWGRIELREWLEVWAIHIALGRVLA